ncbi:MAG TPA: diguanylate cyclase [Burkholderiaceae bacterium]|nr:diguanylate cyclase [Burkholderiaceae bacterium]
MGTKNFRLKLPRIRQLGIRSRLWLLVLALGLPFLTYLALNAARESTAERERIGQQMHAAARLTAARLDDHIGDLRHLLTTLSHVLSADAGATGRNDTLLRKLEPELSKHINNVTVWTRTGENVGSLDPRVREHPFNIADRHYFQNALNAHGIVVEAPIVSSNGEPIAVFALPLLEHGQVVGVVAASTPLHELQTLLNPEKDLPQGGVLTVIDANGSILARSIDPQHWIGKSVPDPSRFKRRLQEKSGVAEIRSVDGTDRIFGFASTESLSWLVYVGMPTDVALAPLRARLARSLAIGAALLLIGLGLAAWVAEQIARPLRRLGVDAAILARGDLTHRSRVKATGEAGQLAATLNRMAEELQERTESLKRSELRLRQVTDNLPLLISQLDAQQRFRFANQAYRDWLGVEPVALIGSSLFELYGTKGYADIRKHVETALRGTKVVYEHNMPTRWGERYVEVTMVPQHEEDGTVQGLYVMIHDISERRDAELRQARSEERLSLALEGSGQALFDWDIRANRIHRGAQASVFRGGPAVETNGDPAEMHADIHPDDIATVLARQKDAMEGTTPLYHAEYRVRTESGGWVWLRSRGHVVERDAEGRALRLAGTDADISQRKATEQRLRDLAELDILTGLPNRGLFMDRLQQSMLRALRHGQPMALMFLDIDHFKRINDTLGHEAGDDLLKIFAYRLAATVRKSDTVARLAGDEFTVILEELHDTADAQALATKLVTAVREPINLAGRVVQVTTSIGVALSASEETDGAALLRRADAALYEAKRRGRDGWWCEGGATSQDGAARR